MSERTKAAPERTKARGGKLVGDRSHMPSISIQRHAASLVARRASARSRAGDAMPLIDDIRQAGASSLRQIANALNKRNTPAARGGA